MPYLVKEDFTPPFYQEILDEITRTDNTIIDTAVKTAIREASFYLNRFDLLKLFGNDSTEAEVEDFKLKDIVKNIAAWQIVKLANPNVSLELIRTAYEDAIEFLEKIQKGQADPGTWPYKPDNPDTPGDENSGIQWTSNPKRIQHF